VRASPDNLATAKNWFGDFRPDNSFGKPTAQQLIVYRLARAKPEEAVEIAKGIQHKTVRACTLAGLALRLKDRDRATGLFDAILDEIVADPNDFTMNNGGGGGTAAVVLFRAKQFGHRDLAGLRDKVLAARTPNDYRHRPDPEINFALALALTDPDTARPILARILPESERAKLDGVRRRNALVALALCDPAGAERAADALLVRVVEAKMGYDFTGIDMLAKLLSQPRLVTETAVHSGGLLVDFGEE